VHRDRAQRHPEDANATISVIRAALRDMYTAETAAAIRILYGGSVKPGNIADLMAMPRSTVA